MLFTFPSRYWCAIGHRGVLRLGGWSPHVQTGFHVPRPTRGPLLAPTRTGLSPSLARRSRRFRFEFPGHWPGPRSLATTSGVASCFPFHRLLRWFSSPGSPHMAIDSPCDTPKGWVAPFGHPRITGRSPLPSAFRSVPRPSSPLGTKASTRCPSCAAAAPSPQHAPRAQVARRAVAPQNARVQRSEDREQRTDQDAASPGLASVRCSL